MGTSIEGPTGFAVNSGIEGVVTCPGGAEGNGPCATSNVKSGLVEGRYVMLLKVCPG